MDKKEKRALVISGGGSKGSKKYKKGKLKFLTKEMLEDLYITQKKSLCEIAKELNVTRMAVSHKAKNLGVKIRSVKEASILANSGDKNPAKRPEVREKLSGKNNHFYGKRHTEESKRKMSASQKKWDRKDWTAIRWTDERKKEFSENNPMYDDSIKEKHLRRLRENRYKFSGENSPRWQGGITEMHKKIMSLSEYKEWRKTIYKIYGKCCVVCGDTKGPFNADHIKAFSIIIKENNIVSIEDAISCNELWDTYNGRILCVSCHGKTDNFGGRV